MKNRSASIKARLLNIAKKMQLSLDYLILRYMQEKIIVRLAKSEYKNNFVLKGGLFFLLHNNLNQRVTKDIDFLGININNTPENIKIVFQKILSIQLDDGLNIEPNTIKIAKIKEDADYEGIRVTFNCSLDKTRKNLQIDIGYGDSVYPNIEHRKYPSLLDDSSEIIVVYPKETVLAEKFEAMIKLSYLNSRMKDFYDINNLISNYEFKGNEIKKALVSTFYSRNTEFISKPDILSIEFSKDSKKNKQWSGFIKKNNLKTSDFENTIENIQYFIKPVYQSILETKDFFYTWNKKKWEKAVK